MDLYEIDFPSVPIFFTKFARDTIMGYYERDCDYKNINICRFDRLYAVSLKF